MSPTLLASIVALVAEAVKLEPQFEQDLKAIFAKNTATPADWQALKDSVLAKKYKDYVPDSKIV